MRGKLKPCPFCGSEAHLMGSGKDDESLFDVICLNRKCTLRAGTQISFFTADSAISAWNNRTIKSAIRAQVIEEVRAELNNLVQIHPETGDVCNQDEGDEPGMLYATDVLAMLDRMKSEVESC